MTLARALRGCTCPPVWNGIVPPPCMVHNPPEPVPDWVHMADVPPTDEEPWVYPIGVDDDADRGLWIGWLLLLVALVIGFVIGWLARG